MAKIKKELAPKKETFEQTYIEPLKIPQTKEEKLEYHLGRLGGNFLSKQEVRAIFQSLFRD